MQTNQASIRKPVAVIDRGIRSEQQRSIDLAKRLCSNRQFRLDVKRDQVPSGIRIA